MNARPSILVLSAEPPYPPTFGGARLRLYETLRLLVDTHDFTLLTLLESPEERSFLPPLEKICRKVLAFDRRSLDVPTTWADRVHSPFRRLAYTDEMAAAIARELKECRYDLVHVDTPRVAVYTSLLNGVPKIISATDSATLGYQSKLGLAMGFRNRWRARYLLRKVKRFEAREYPKYDACVVIADRDRDVIHGLCPELPVHVVPNGIDLAHFGSRPTGSEVSERLIFTGTMDYAPNVDAVLWFVREILPQIEKARPKISFEVVGRNPTPAIQALGKQPNVTVTGYVDDLRPHLGAAAVYVCPLRSGSGMKNKMLEAMAAGKAIVTTSEGTSGIAARTNHEFVVADDARAFAAAVVDLLSNSERRQQLSRAARSFVEQHFSWERTADSFRELYGQVSGRQGN